MIIIFAMEPFMCVLRKSRSGFHYVPPNMNVCIIGRNEGIFLMLSYRRTEFKFLPRNCIQQFPLNCMVIHLTINFLIHGLVCRDLFLCGDIGKGSYNDGCNWIIGGLLFFEYSFNMKSENQHMTDQLQRQLQDEDKESGQLRRSILQMKFQKPSTHTVCIHMLRLMFYEVYLHTNTYAQTHFYAYMIYMEGDSSCW
ncbi:uncharacterized protein LOC113295291 isoform X3 [Papaver somniferum]|uniref:uncharacterized protein LOC113295291 isoform X3 n=1 Tax=Papaver somniferum TaxID=3469 RepID=UPI000E6F9F15|nr:uncharacterized protein LOC113295291 isoform X3 [Papaver somniferum]